MWLTIFWGIISLLFLSLAILHLIWSRHMFLLIEYKGGVAKVMGVPVRVKETVEEINNFIDRFNKHNKRMNRVQVLGYLAAFSVALSSFITSLLTNI